MTPRVTPPRVTPPQRSLIFRLFLFYWYPPPGRRRAGMLDGVNDSGPYVAQGRTDGGTQRQFSVKYLFTFEGANVA